MSTRRLHYDASIRSELPVQGGSEHCDGGKEICDLQFDPLKDSERLLLFDVYGLTPFNRQKVVVRLMESFDHDVCILEKNIVPPIKCSTFSITALIPPRFPYQKIINLMLYYRLQHIINPSNINHLIRKPTSTAAYPKCT